MSVWKSILSRLNNRGTIVALAALIVSLLCQFGLDINSDKVMGIIESICSILLLLGLLNDQQKMLKLIFQVFQIN